MEINASRERNGVEALGLSRRPVAIGFLDEPPAGVEPWRGGAQPAGCAFWRSAMDGNSFYTVPSDHYNCAVGAHTHGLPLPEDRASQLTDTIAFMVAQQYLDPAEVAGIPVLAQSPPVIAYAPADRATFRADLVLAAARPRAVMLLYEAALAAGAGAAMLPGMGRPACAVLPLTANSGAAAVSFGCAGNRTFTGIGDDEMYVCIPGERWLAVASELGRKQRANQAMAERYQAQRARFDSA